MERATVLHVCAIGVTLRMRRRALVEPWFGAELRGVFGAVLRQLSCRVGGMECSVCPLARTCAYGYAFETPIPGDAAYMKLYTHAPHPFVFLSPLTDEVSPERPISLTVVLIGRAMDYLPYFLIALEEVGRRGLGRDRVGFRIEHKTDLRTGLWVDENTAAGSELGFPIDPAMAWEADQSAVPNRLSIRLETPLWLSWRGEMADRFSFQGFVSSMVRRIESLGWWHCGVDLRGRYNPLVDRAADVDVTLDATRRIFLARRSARQKREIPVGGLLGDVIVEGELAPFLGLLLSASYLGVGKKTAFGLGRITFQAIGREPSASPGEP